MAEGAGRLNLKKRRLRGDFLILFNSLMGGLSQDWGNGLKLHQGSFKLGIRENLLERVVRLWNRLHSGEAFALGHFSHLCYPQQ